MNKSYSKIRHIQESNQRLEKRFIGESKFEESIISEQSTSFAAVFPTVNLLTTKDVKTQPLMGGTNNTNIIYLSKRDANGRPVPNTKFSYKLTGRYKFIPFNIILRNVHRDASGVLRAEALPSNGLVKKAMQALIGKKYLTDDGWLNIAAPADKINAALVQLHNNQGSEAKLSLNGGVDITLEQV
jgi:hypothetical protein